MPRHLAGPNGSRDFRVPPTLRYARIPLMPAMKRDRDGRFQPRLGPPRDRGKATRERFINRVVRSASRSGEALDYRVSPARPGSRLGCGYAAAHLAGRTLGPRSRAGSRQAPHRQACEYQAGALRENLDYIERDGVQPDGSLGHLEPGDREQIDAESFARRIEPDRHHFTIIVSPEDGAQIGVLKTTLHTSC